MPSKRQRRTRQRRAEIPANVLAYLKDDFSGSPEVARSVRGAVYFNDIAAWWGLMIDEILEDWAREQPGTRPRAWWQYDSQESRRRLGGIGTPSNECHATAPHLVFGIPTYWVDQREVDYRNGRAFHVDGYRIGTENKEGDFDGLAIDRDDPPRYESEAAYLKRCGLLFPGELERLTEAAFEPEIVLPAEDDEAA